MKLYVGNLPKQVTDAQLNELAQPFGKIISAQVVMDRASGASKGFGFIEFGSAAEGNAAITALHGKEMHGQALMVNEARPKKEKAGSY